MQQGLLTCAGARREALQEPAGPSNSVPEALPEGWTRQPTTYSANITQLVAHLSALSSPRRLLLCTDTRSYGRDEEQQVLT